MEITPAKRKLSLLMDQAYQGKLALPDFQREFVWSREEVADLLRSVLRQYFIGSFLLLQSDPQRPPFAPVFLRGAKSNLKVPEPDLLVLDGQQRLSALLYALSAPDMNLKDSSQRRWFFIDLKLLLTDLYEDEVVFDRSKKELEGFLEKEVQYRERILPCPALLTSKGFYDWRDGLDDWLRDKEPDNHKLFREKWRDTWTRSITDFQSFEVPVVELPRIEEGDSNSIGTVCAIFEKLNSTGVELSVYDLLTARLYRSGKRLHDLWDSACREHKLLAEWSKGKADTNKFGVLVLRTLALLRGLDPKPRILIDLSPVRFEEDWRRAAAAMETAIVLISHMDEDGFGVFEKKWLPGFGLLPVLAALRSEIETRKLGPEARSDLRRWYWSNVFLERYSSAVESKSRKDYSELLKRWTENDKNEPAVFTEAKARIGSAGFTVRESASYASAVYSGVFALLVLNRARDWRRGESIQLQDLEDHHLFPRAYLNRHGLEKKSDVNSIVNRTLISDETNRKIRDQAPADYLASREIFPSGATPALLEPHFISESVLELMRRAKDSLTEPEVKALFESFRSARERLIIAEIQKACGIAPVSTTTGGV